MTSKIGWLTKFNWQIKRFDISLRGQFSVCFIKWTFRQVWQVCFYYFTEPAVVSPCRKMAVVVGSGRRRRWPKESLQWPISSLFYWSMFFLVLERAYAATHKPSLNLHQEDLSLSHEGNLICYTTNWHFLKVFKKIILRFEKWWCKVFERS